MTASADPTIIVGGGVVGLHVGLALATARPGAEVFILEKEAWLGAHASGRNSQMIHAGLAYPVGSLKARLCVEGNRLTYGFLEALDVPHARSGKWIVAHTEDERPALDQVLALAKACGVHDLRFATTAEFERSEPGAHPVAAALLSPSSGMVDAAAYLAALARRFAQVGGQLLLSCEVTGIDPTRRVVATTRGDLAYGLLVNCAGLWSDVIHRQAGGTRDLRVKPFKGEYYTWRTSAVRTAIYPVPTRFLPGRGDDPRLLSNMGVHVHRDTGGALYVGPTQVELDWDDRARYDLVTPRASFVEQAARYAPVASPDDLAPGYSGNRAKLYEGGKALGDFQIFRDGDHIHLLAIESPGLTAAPAIARHVAALALA